MYKKSLLDVVSTVGSKNMLNNQFYSLGWNKLILIDTTYTITVLYGRINCYSVIPIYSQLYGL